MSIPVIAWQRFDLHISIHADVTLQVWFVLLRRLCAAARLPISLHSTAPSALEGR